MPDREKLADFGIEDTIDAGDKEVLGAFFGTGSQGNPDDVELIDDDKPKGSSTTESSTTKPIAVKFPKEGEKKDEVKKPTNEELANALLDNEEENPEEKAAKEKKALEDKGGQESTKTTMASLAEEMQGLGIFAKEEDEDGKEVPVDPALTPEEFVKTFQLNQRRSINEAIEGFLGQFGDDYREMFDAVFVNGVDPRAYLQTFNKLSDIASLDITKEGDQERIYKEWFRRQGFPEDKIEAKVAKAKVNGDLEDEATEYHKILIDQDAKELESMKLQKEQRNQEEKKSKQLFLQSVNKILSDKLKEKEFDGIPLTDQIAREGFNFLTQEKYKLPTGETLTEFDKFILELKRPENHALKVKLALLAIKKFDLSNIKIKERNDQISKSFDWATKNRTVTSGRTQPKTTIKEAEPFI